MTPLHIYYSAHDVKLPWWKRVWERFFPPETPKVTLSESGDFEIREADEDLVTESRVRKEPT